jgi:hypothetical protein
MGQRKLERVNEELTRHSLANLDRDSPGSGNKKSPWPRDIRTTGAAIAKQKTLRHTRGAEGPS